MNPLIVFSLNKTLITIRKLCDWVWLLRLKWLLSSPYSLSSKFIQSLIMSFLRSCLSFYGRGWVWSLNSDFLLLNLNFLNYSFFDCGYLKLGTVIFGTLKRFMSLALLFVNHRRSDKAFTLQELFIWLSSRICRLCLLPISLSRRSALSWRLSSFKDSLRLRIENFLDLRNQSLFITCKRISWVIFNSKNVNFQLIQNQFWNLLLRGAKTSYKLHSKIITSGESHLNFIYPFWALWSNQIFKSELKSWDLLLWKLVSFR